MALCLDALGRTALNRRLRASESAISIGMGGGAAGILPVDKPIHDGWFTCRQLDTWLILTCGMPAGRPGVKAPVGRDLSYHLLTPAFAARKLHQKPGRPHGEGLGAVGRGAYGTGLASPGVSGGRRSSSDPGRAGRPTAGCREPAATRQGYALKGGS